MIPWLSLLFKCNLWYILWKWYFLLLKPIPHTTYSVPTYTSPYLSAIPVFWVCRLVCLQTQKSPPLRSDHMWVKDAQFAETDEKIKFVIFGFWVMVDFVLKILRKLSDFEYKIYYILKTKNCKHQKIDFTFVSAHSASFI